MDIRTLLKTLSYAALITSFTTSFAANNHCPAPDKIRSLGSKFSYAYNIDGEFKWALVSDAFTWNGQGWQTLYTSNVTAAEPITALYIGQQSFDHSPLVMHPTSTESSDGNEIKCYYAPIGADYEVMAATPVGYGMRRS